MMQFCLIFFNWFGNHEPANRQILTVDSFDMSSFSWRVWECLGKRIPIFKNVCVLFLGGQMALKALNYKVGPYQLEMEL